MLKFSRKTIIILLIMVLAIILRFYQLGQIPDGFTGDEAAFGYYAFSIAKSGTDEYGNFLPIYFKSIGDFKYPAYVYLSVPFVSIFGLSEFSARFLSALAGVISVYLLFILVKLLTKNFYLAISSMLLLAISPWHIFFSRGVFESNLGLMFFITGLIFLIKFFEGAGKKFAPLFILTFVLGIYSYSPYRILFPAISLWVLIIYLTQKKLKPKLKLAAGLIILVFLLTGLSFIDPAGRARADNLVGSMPTNLNVDTTSLLIHDGINDPGNTKFARLYHNKYLTTSLNYFAQYLNHFNADLLFINGDKTRSMFNIPNMGLLYIFEIPLLFIGLIYIFNNFRKLFLLSVGWIIVGIVPSALVSEQPNTVRFLSTVPAFAVFSGAGLYQVIRKLLSFKNLFSNAALGIIAVIIFFNFSYMLHQYFVHNTYYRPWSRDKGAAEMVNTVNQIKNNYEKVVISGDPYIFFLFYGQVKPKDFVNQAKFNHNNSANWDSVSSFGNIVFNMPINCPGDGKKGVLYVCKGYEIPQNAKLIKLIYFADKTPAFSLIEFKTVEEIGTPPELPEGLDYMVEVNGKTRGIIPDEDQRYW